MVMAAGRSISGFNLCMKWLAVFSPALSAALNSRPLSCIQTPCLNSGRPSKCILRALVIRSAILNYLRLKLIETESSVLSTECQMPAGWYKTSPSFRITVVASLCSLAFEYARGMFTPLNA